VVGSKWKKIVYMRSRPGKRTGKSSQKQLEQEAKFAAMIDFMAPYSTLLSTTFADPANKQSGYNAAVSFNIARIIEGDYPNFTINYSKAFLSRGKLDGAANAAASAIAGGVINFTWTNYASSDIKDTDTAILIVYNSTDKRGLYTVSTTLRSAAAASRNVGQWVGKTVETWLVFISADGKSLSDSMYTGQVTVLA
jgi:hypothetical protein